MFAPGITAVREVELTKVVAKSAPFQRTTESETKLVPVAWTTVSPLPAGVDVGVSEVRVGAGLFVVNICGADEPPPFGVKTVMGKVPPTAIFAAGTDAVREVALTKVVAKSTPFQRRTELETKSEPVAVRVNAAPPVLAELGLIEARTGAGLLMEKVRAADVPPPGAGINTVTEAVPAVAMFAAGTVAVSEEKLTKVVARSAPFQRTFEEELKFVPVAVSVKEGPPTIAELALIEDRVGARLLIVNVRVLDVPPPGAGLNTVIRAVPAVAMFSIGMVALRALTLETEVGIATPFHLSWVNPV